MQYYCLSNFQLIVWNRKKYTYNDEHEENSEKEKVVATWILKD